MRDKIVGFNALGPGKLKKRKRAHEVVDKFYENYSIQEISAIIKYVFFKANLNENPLNIQTKDIEIELINLLKAVNLIRER